MKKIFPPRGTRDILPRDKKLRDKTLEILLKTYEKFGFTSIETPAIEAISNLCSENNDGGENEKLLFKILKRGLNDSEKISPQDAVDLGLRYDLTIPLSRFYATNYASLPTVFKAIQFGYVWRAERPQKGRFRQFKQCDIDIIGDPTNTAECQLIIATITAFKNLKIDNLCLQINDRKLVNALFDDLNIAESTKKQIIITLDKLDKIGRDAVLEQVAELTDSKTAENILDKIEYLNSNSLEELVDGSKAEISESFSGPLQNIKEITDVVKSVFPKLEIKFSPYLMRGMGYYTGTIFEIKNTKLSYSIAGGGRYDGVIGRFLNKEVCACGFSIGFERIIELLSEDTIAKEKKLAVVYEKDIDKKMLFSLQSYLSDSFDVVSLVKMPRKLNKTFWEELENSSYSDAFLFYADKTQAVQDCIQKNTKLDFKKIK